MAGLGPQPRPAVFLDRDGTLNERPADHDYVRSSDAFAWLPGAIEGIVALAGAGFALFVVSNQRGVARGLIGPGVLDAIERRVQSALAPHGVAIEAFRYCVHELDAGCDCRKPAPGMLLDLSAEHVLDRARSWMVGDSASDMEAGRAAGCRCALIAPPGAETGADATAPGLLELARAIVAASAELRPAAGRARA